MFSSAADLLVAERASINDTDRILKSLMYIKIVRARVVIVYCSIAPGPEIM